MKKQRLLLALLLFISTFKVPAYPIHMMFNHASELHMNWIQLVDDLENELSKISEDFLLEYGEQAQHWKNVYINQLRNIEDDTVFSIIYELLMNLEPPNINDSDISKFYVEQISSFTIHLFSSRISNIMEGMFQAVADNFSSLYDLEFSSILREFTDDSIQKIILIENTFINETVHTIITSDSHY